MKKKLQLNNNGFMLVEVVIVTVVVATIMVSLYVAFNRVYDAYDLKAKYTNIDALYAIRTIEDQLIDEMKFSEAFSGFTNGYKEFTCDIYDSASTAKTYCKSVFERYKISDFYYVELETDDASGNKVLPDLSSLSVNQTFKDYINYLNNAVTFKADSNYVFLVETYEYATDEDGDGIDESNKDILNKYAYLEVK